MDMMNMKEQLLEELLEKLAGDDGMNLKPKSAGVAMLSSDGDDDEAPKMNAQADDDEMGDEDIKKLLSHYMGM